MRQGQAQQNVPNPGAYVRPRPGDDLAAWGTLAADTWRNETQRRILIHDRLASSGSVRPEQIKRWLYKEILEANLDDPFLGLGDTLFGDDVFRQVEALRAVESIFDFQRASRVSGGRIRVLPPPTREARFCSN